MDWANPLANSLLVEATPLSEMAVQPEIKAGSIGLSARAGVLKRGAVTHGLANSTVFIVSQPLLPDNGSWWNGNGTIYADTKSAWPGDIGLRVLPPKNYGRISVASRATNGTVYAADVDVLDGGQSFGGVFTGAATVASDLLVTGFGGGKRWGTATGLQGYSYNTPPPTALGPIFGQLASAAGPMDFLSLVFRWGRVLSDEEIFEVERNPWQLFRADPVRIYSLPTGPVVPSWSSLTAGNITQAGATLTLGGIVR